MPRVCVTSRCSWDGRTMSCTHWSWWDHPRRLGRRRLTCSTRRRGRATDWSLPDCTRSLRRPKAGETSNARPGCESRSTSSQGNSRAHQAWAREPGRRPRRPSAHMSVCRAIRVAVDRITQEHPALGAHLAVAVKTGTFCAYNPDPARPSRGRRACGIGQTRFAFVVRDATGTWDRSPCWQRLRSPRCCCTSPRPAARVRRRRRSRCRQG
jgi:hypothetical protein